MSLLNSVASWLMVKRMHQIELFMKYPHQVQEEWLQKLLNAAKDTEWGKKYDFASIYTPEEFANRFPVQDYESHKPYIDRLRRGEQNLLWPGEIKWFAKSSGTTNDKSKFIPVSTESLEDCHYKGGKDMLSIYCANHPESQLFTGKSLGLGGSHKKDIFDNNYESYHGDVSAIIIQNLPMWAEYLRAPSIDIALMDEWEAKLEKLATSTMDENITSIAGVPSWLQILLRRILDIKGKKTISEVWPNLEVYFHGGVSFAPYRKQFEELIGKDNMFFLELYNASEGFFGIQDQKNSNDLLLMLDYGIYYEFIPSSEWEKEHPKTLTLHELSVGQTYSLVISTTAGLWRYQVGDTITITSISPFRFKISGRTKHHINVFGEELMIDNAEKALVIASEKTGCRIAEYTACPVFMDGGSGGHEWVIEFEKEPENVGYFTEVLDNALKSLNSDYEAKRYHNKVLNMPVLRKVPQGTFYNWMKGRNKLGGQHKVPRLSNERRYVEEILSTCRN